MKLNETINELFGMITQLIQFLHIDSRTVTYGIASAPFLAIRTLFQLAEDEKHIFSVASETLQHDFYVDDVLTGTYSLDQIIEVQR